MSESEWHLISLVIDVTVNNSAQRLQIFPSVYSSLVIVDLTEQGQPEFHLITSSRYYSLSNL